MDEKQIVSKEFVRLLRMAIFGDTKGATSLGRKMSRTFKDSEPAFSEQLASVLKEKRETIARRTPSPFREAATASFPVDRDSRHHLLRVDGADKSLHQPLLPEEILDQLHQIILERKQVSKLRKAGLEPSRTILFVGAPGVGKTLTARWLASVLDKTLFSLDLSAVMSSFLGRTGANLKSVLEYAKAEDGVLLLDEFDAIAKRRADESEVGELKRLVTVLLQEIDLWPSNRILIAATNHGDLLDPAVWRRFDVVIRFPVPNIEQLTEFILDHSGDELRHDWAHALAIALNGRSYGEIIGKITQARRLYVLQGTAPEATFRKIIHDRVSSLTKSERKQLAISLGKAGLSQREINGMTGLARDTLRVIGVTGSGENNG